MPLAIGFPQTDFEASLSGLDSIKFTSWLSLLGLKPCQLRPAVTLREKCRYNASLVGLVGAILMGRGYGKVKHLGNHPGFLTDSDENSASEARGPGKTEGTSLVEAHEVPRCSGY